MRSTSIDPATAHVYAAVLLGWATSVLTRSFVRLYLYLDNLPPRKDTTLNTSRPRPLRTAASIIGGLTAVISGLVGSGLLSAGQGTAVTGVINAVVALLGAFGYVIATERKVTPIADPQDDSGQALVAAEPGPNTTV